MEKEFNYFTFLFALIFGCFIGIFFPDISYGFQNTLGHRSIITHSIFLPSIMYFFLKKKNNLTNIQMIVIIGIYLGIGVHLSADLYPEIWSGYSLIKLFNGINIGLLSPIWIGINTIISIFLASYYFNKSIHGKLYWITYLVVALVTGVIYALYQLYNIEKIIGTFLTLLFLTFVYSKLKYKKKEIL